MSENYDQFRTQVLDCILDATENSVVSDVSRNSYHEEIAQTFIKDQLWSDARVGATEDHGEWVLTGNQFPPPACGFVGMSFFVSDKTGVPG